MPHDSIYVPYTPLEILGAFHVFKSVSPQDYTIFFLRTLDVPFLKIAAMEGITPKEAEKRFTKTQETLFRKLESLLETELRRHENFKPAPSDESDPTAAMVRRMFQLVDPKDMEAFRLFKKKIPKKAIAKKLGVPLEEAERRIDAAGNFFHRRLIVLINQFLSPDVLSSPPFDSLRIPVQHALRMRDFYFEGERQKSILGSIREVPQLTRSEMREADRALFAMPQFLREVFLLSEGTNLNTQQMSDYLHLPYAKVEQATLEFQKFLTNRILQMTARYFQDENSPKPQLSASERNTVRRGLKALNEEETEILQKNLAGESMAKIALGFGENEETIRQVVLAAQSQLGGRLWLLIGAWIRLAMDGTPEREDATFASKKRTFVKKRLLRKFGLIEYTLLLTDPQMRDPFLQVYGKNRDTKRVAAMLGAHQNVVEERLRYVWHVFHERFQVILPRFLAVRLGVIKQSDLQRGEYLFAKSVYETLPIRNREILAAYTFTNEPDAKIAREYGMSQKEFKDLLHQTDEMIASEIRRTVVEKLTKKKNGHSLASRIIRRLKKKYRPFVFSTEKVTPPASVEQKDAEELQKDEVRVMLSSATSQGRKAFWLSRTGTASLGDLVLFTGLNESEAKRACNATVELLHQRVEECVDGVLQRKKLSPGAELIGETAIAQVSEQSLEAYRRYYVENESIKEIAKKEGVTAKVLRQRIEDARKMFHQRIEQLALKLLDPPHEYAPEHSVVGDDVLHVASIQRSKKMTPPDEWEKQLQIVRSASDQFDRKNAVAPQVTDSWQFHDSDSSVNSAFRDLRGAIWNTCKKRVTSLSSLFTPLFGLPTLDSATKPIWGMVSNAFMLAAIPFLWVMSLFICGQLYGIYFVRSAPTLNARRWIIWQIFSIYCMIVIVHIGVYAALVAIVVLFQPGQTLMAIILPSAGVLLLSFWWYILKRLMRHNEAWTEVTNPHNAFNRAVVDLKWNDGFETQNYVGVGASGSFELLKQLMNAGLSLVGVLIFSCVGYVVWDVILPLIREEKSPLPTCIVMGGLLIIYIGSIFMFHYLLEMSKDEQTFISSSQPVKWQSVKLHEFLCILPFAIFPISIGIGHICYNNFRPLLTIFDMLLCTLCWLQVWLWNIKSPEKRGYRIFGAIIGLVVLTRILRHVIYPMFF